MSLPSSGAISISQLSNEIALASTTTLGLNDSRVRTLAGKPTEGSAISLSDLYGKSNFTYTAYSGRYVEQIVPPGVIYQAAPGTIYGTGIAISATNTALNLTRAVGYASNGAVVFDRSVAQGTAGGAWNVANDSTVGTYLLRVWWQPANPYANGQYRLTLYRLVVYDTNGNGYECNKHRNFAVSGSAAVGGAGITPNYTVINPNN